MLSLTFLDTIQALVAKSQQVILPRLL